MNRQTKRLMQKQEKAGAAGKDSKSGGRKPPPQAGGKKKKIGARQFLKEVRQELKKVQWPTRKEMISYSTVVLVTVVVLATFVFAMDVVFSKAAYELFGG